MRIKRRHILISVGFSTLALGVGVLAGYAPVSVRKKLGEKDNKSTDKDKKN